MEQKTENQTLVKTPKTATLPQKILCFIFPLVGLLLFIVNYHAEHTVAKACGKWALIGTVTVVVIYIVAFLLMFLIGGNFVA